MKLFTIACPILTLLLIAAFYTNPVMAQQKTTAPNWVNELPVSAGSLFAVGVVNKHYEKKAGEEAAANAAKMELAQTIKLNVKTITKSWGGTTTGSGFVSDMEKSIDEDVLASVQSAKILETWVDPEGLIYALAELPLSGAMGSIEKKVVEQAKKQSGGKEEYKKIEKLELSLKALADPKSYIRTDVPEWIKVLPEDDDAIFAVGIAEKFYYYVNGRESAKDKARAELGATIQSEVQAVLTDWYEVNEGTSSYVSERSIIDEMAQSVSETTLSGSQIIETWYNKQTKWHYALARMSLSEVISKVNEKAKSKISDTKSLKGLSDKLNGMINRDYLKLKNGRPSWVTTMPKAKDAIFAVGIDEGKYFSQTQGIEKAKMAARTKLAKSIEVEVESVMKSWLETKETSESLSDQPLNDYMSQMTKEATDVCLEGSQIVSTYIYYHTDIAHNKDEAKDSKKDKDKKKDKKKDKGKKDKKDDEGSKTYGANVQGPKESYYALGRIYMGGLQAKLKKKASQLIKLPEAKSDDEEIQDKAEKILSGGREKAKAALERLNAAFDKLGEK